MGLIKKVVAPSAAYLKKFVADINTMKVTKPTLALEDYNTYSLYGNIKDKYLIEWVYDSTKGQIGYNRRTYAGVLVDFVGVVTMAGLTLINSNPNYLIFRKQSETIYIFDKRAGVIVDSFPYDMIVGVGMITVIRKGIYITNTTVSTNTNLVIFGSTGSLYGSTTINGNYVTYHNALVQNDSYMLIKFDRFNAGTNYVYVCLLDLKKFEFIAQLDAYQKSYSFLQNALTNGGYM